jgi:hypothetical protein
MTFFIGLHHECDAWPFQRAMISINTLRRRKSDFRVNDWILDSGAFSQISKHGRFVMAPAEYALRIDRWRACGNLVCAVAQDWMCEPFILAKTGKSVAEHQALTIQSYVDLSSLSSVQILPVLQGFTPLDYVRHLRGYGTLLEPSQWVGVGSVCKRNGSPEQLEDVLLAIKSERADLRLHGFGLKIQALESPTVRGLLHSSDSMAWSFADRYEGGNGHDPREALRYVAKVQAIIQEPCFIQPQLFAWWN